MRKATIAHIVALLLSLVFAAAASAQAQPIQNLETTFGVTAAQISGLQSQGLGFGEIAVVLSIASRMTGGITDANIAAIMALRQGTPPMGWGQIAQSVAGTSLGGIVSGFASANGAAHSNGANAGGNGHGQGSVNANFGRSGK